MVTQRKSSGQALKPIEIKLTALPDNTTCELSENKYGTEIVIRPDTIVYLACNIAFNFRDKLDELSSRFTSEFEKIDDWTEGTDVWAYLPKMLETIDASYCGVPQARKRFFLVGSLDENDDFLLPHFSKNLSKEQMTIFDYLGDSLGVEHYYRHPRSYKRRGVFSIHEPSPTIRGVNRPIPSGYPKHPGDTADVSGNVGPLTTIERSYIQTFPKDFVFNGSKTNLEQIIGNAVPVKLGEFVARALNEYIKDKKENKLRHNGQLRFAMEPEMKYKSTVPNNV